MKMFFIYGKLFAELWKQGIETQIISHDSERPNKWILLKIESQHGLYDSVCVLVLWNI